jgi:thiol-disulfide isomerase/thioredoxin
MKKLLIIVLFCLTLSGCQKQDFNDDFPMMRNFTHVYEKVDYEKAFDILENETGVLLLAFDSNKYMCPYCQSVLPILNEVAIKLAYPKIYYLDIFEMRNNNTPEYQELLNYIDTQVDDLLEKSGKTALVVPDVYFIKAGKIVAHHIATLYDDNSKLVSDLNQDQILTLKMIYEEMFALIK